MISVMRYAGAAFSVSGAVIGAGALNVSIAEIVCFKSHVISPDCIVIKPARLFII